MIRLNLPEYQFKIQRKDDAKLYIYDELRKKNVVLTPEEWVRQNFIQYMNLEKGIPLSMMVIEKEIELNSLKKRIDLLIYDKNRLPFLIVECKAPHIKINQDTFDQAARYNLTVNAPFLVITNGLEHYYSAIDLQEKTTKFLKDFPPY